MSKVVNLFNVKQLLSNSEFGLQYAQLLRFVTLFVAGILLAKTGVALSIISTYEYMLLAASMVSYFWLNGLVQNLLANYHTQQKTLAHATVRLCLVLGVIALVGYIPLSLGQNTTVFGVFAVFVLLNGAAMLVDYYLMLTNRGVALFAYSSLSNALHLVLVYYCIVYKQSLPWFAAGMGVLAMVKVGWLFFATYTPLPKNELKNLLLQAWPLMLAALLSGAVDYVASLSVKFTQPLESFAVYRYGAKELPITLLLANGFSNAIVPVLAQLRNNPLEAAKTLKERSLPYVIALMTLSIVCMPAAKYLFPLVFSAQFALSAMVFNVFLVLVISRVVFPQALLLGLGQHKALTIAAAIELAMGVVFCLWGGIAGGVVGVAIGLLLANFTEKAVLVYLLYKAGIAPSTYIPLKQWAFFSAAVLGGFCITYLILP